MFGLEEDEMFLTAQYDKDKNKLIVESLLSMDETKGDI